jgi:uncharacterized protein (UPF0335 family)
VTDASVIDTQSNAAGEELRQFIERIERLESEKKDITDGIKEVFAELKGRGYDAPAVREILKLRAADPDDIAEKEAVLDLYKNALGMS